MVISNSERKRDVIGQEAISFHCNTVISLKPKCIIVMKFNTENKEKEQTQKVKGKN